MQDQQTEDPWFKIVTLINRALLLTEDQDEAVLLKMALQQAREEAQILMGPLRITPIRWH